MFNHHEDHKHVYIFLAGMLIGTGFGYFLSSTPDKRREVYRKMHFLKNKVVKSSQDIQETLQDIFGVVNDDVKSIYNDMRKQVSKNVSEAKQYVSLNRQNYEDIVNDAVNKLSKDKDWSMYQIDKLKRSLRDEWRDISRNL